jgi:hypothetical protein
MQMGREAEGERESVGVGAEKDIGSKRSKVGVNIEKGWSIGIVMSVGDLAGAEFPGGERGRGVWGAGVPCESGAGGG